MGNRCPPQGDGKHFFLGPPHCFLNRPPYIRCFTQTNPNLSFFVTNGNEDGKADLVPAFNFLGNSVDLNYFFDKLFLLH